MKKLMWLVTVSFLISCSKSFKRIDPTAFNTEIAARTDIRTPEDLMRLYYDNGVTEGTSKFSIELSGQKDSTHMIILIHEGLGDDSQAGVKIIMTAKQKGKGWEVAEIKKNWKCRDGRGHTEWGTGLCN